MAILCPGCKQALTPGDSEHRRVPVFSRSSPQTPAEDGHPAGPRRRGIIRMTELLHAEQEPYAGKVRTALLEACGVKERYA